MLKTYGRLKGRSRMQWINERYRNRRRFADDGFVLSLTVVKSATAGPKPRSLGLSRTKPVRSFSLDRRLAHCLQSENELQVTVPMKSSREIGPRCVSVVLGAALRGLRTRDVDTFRLSHCSVPTRPSKRRSSFMTHAVWPLYLAVSETALVVILSGGHMPQTSDH